MYFYLKGKKPCALRLAGYQTLILAPCFTARVLRLACLASCYLLQMKHSAKRQTPPPFSGDGAGSYTAYFFPGPCAVIAMDLPADEVPLHNPQAAH